MLHTFVALVQDKPGVLTRVALATVFVCSPMLLLGQSTKVHIRMVDGRNGRPWGKKHIEVNDATSDPRYPPKTLLAGKTDKHGVFVLDLDSSVVINVTSSSGPPCVIRGQTVLPKWRIADIAANGAIQENSCNFRIAVTPTPGELVVFFRPESLKEILD